MKKILFILPLLAVALVSCNKDNGDELSGDDIIQFKDPNFLQALLTVQGIDIYDLAIDNYKIYTMNIDKDKDGQISLSEAKEVKGIQLWNTETEEPFNVSAMPEIKYFTSLTHLDCIGNQLTVLDINECPSLINLYCEDNQLTELNVNRCSSLVYLECGGNKLTSLDISGCANMDALGCENNQLSSLNVGECTFLTHLECYNNQLTTLDLSGCTALSGLVCYNNPLTKIILPRNHHISDFRIQEITEEYGDIIEYAE